MTQPALGPTKRARPLVTPPTVKSASAAPFLAHSRKALITRGPQLLESAEEYVGAIALLAAMDGGFSGSGLRWLLSSLPMGEITDGGVLLVRERRSEHDKAASVTLPAGVELLYRMAAHRLGRVPVPAEIGDFESPNHAERASGVLLSCAVAALQAVNDSSAAGVLQSVSWKVVERSSAVIAIGLGIPPVLITLNAAIPFPQHPWWVQPGLTGGPLDPAARALALENAVAPHDLHDPRRESQSTRSKAGNAGAGERRVWAFFVKHLKRINSRKYSDHQLLKVERLRTRIMRLILDRHWPKTSAIHLALEWGAWRLGRKTRPSANTLEEYFGLLWRKGFLLSGAKDDLRQFDEREFDAFADRVMEDAHEPSSVQKNSKLVASVVRFAASNGYCQTFSYHVIVTMTMDNARRARIIGLHEVDQLISWVTRGKSFKGALLAVGLIISFFGGVRPDELAKIKLKWIDPRDGELNIRIPSGKTGASRRVIPLHLFAPLEYVEFVRRVVIEATERASASPLKEAWLFDPNDTTGIRDINKAIATVVRRAFGEDVVPYQLRHSFLSWAFIKLMALGTPGILDDLVDGRHRFFSDEAMKRFRRFCAAAEFGCPENMTPATGLIALAIVVGHCEFSTMQEHYIHVVGIVQGGVQRAINARVASIVLPAECAAAIAGVSSSASVAKLVKSVGGMLSFQRQRAGRADAHTR